MSDYLVAVAAELDGGPKMDDRVRELIEAARPFAYPRPQPTWPCHWGDPERWASCSNCNRIKRLQAAIDAAEAND